jgi:hypothetical protein
MSAWVKNDIAAPFDKVRFVPIADMPDPKEKRVKGDPGERGEKGDAGPRDEFFIGPG